MEEILLQFLWLAVYRDRNVETYTGAVDKFYDRCTDEEWKAFRLNRDKLSYEMYQREIFYA